MLAKIVSWAVAIGLLVIPVGGVPQVTDYQSIQNPSAQVQTVQASVRRAGILNQETQDAALAVLRTFLGSINNKDIDRSTMTKAMAALPVRDLADNRGKGKTGLVPSVVKGVWDYQLFLLPTEDKNVYELAANYAQTNGRQMQSKTGILYNTKTSELFTGSAMPGTDRNINMEHIFFFNETQTWQQRFGFNTLYDVMSPLLLYDLDCLRVKFPYNGKDWMFQLWKGSYTAVSNGVEVGIYEKPQSRRVEHYDCSKLMLPMEVSLYRGDTLMLKHKMEKTWWLTAFQPGLKIKPAKLTMDTAITFDDANMQKLFVEKLSTRKGVSNVTQNGRTVRFLWK